MVFTDLLAVGYPVIGDGLQTVMDVDGSKGATSVVPGNPGAEFQQYAGIQAATVADPVAVGTGMAFKLLTQRVGCWQHGAGRGQV